MSLPQAIKTMLHGTTGITDANITYGQRNQQEGLPAVTYLITRNEKLTIGPTATALKQCDVDINCFALTAEDAQDIGEAVLVQLATGTYNSIVFHGVEYELPMLEEPTNGEGEESEPFVCSVSATITYEE